MAELLDELEQAETRCVLAARRCRRRRRRPRKGGAARSRATHRPLPPTPRPLHSLQTKEAAALRLSCQLNEAQMCLKREEWAAAAAVCTSVLEREPENVKALFRRGTARAKSAEYAAARADLLAASKLDPKSKEIREAFTACKEAEAAAKAKDKAFAAKMFG